MFDDEIKIFGKHADYVRALKDEKKEGIPFFDTTMSLYKISSILGFLYQRKAQKDNDDSNVTSIFAGQVSKIRDDLFYNYRVIVLLDEENESDFKIRMQKAFDPNADNSKELELFNQYSLGGIEILYEKLITEKATKEDLLQNLFDFISDFNSKFNEDVNSESLVDLARKLNA